MLMACVFPILFLYKINQPLKRISNLIMDKGEKNSYQKEEGGVLGNLLCHSTQHGIPLHMSLQLGSNE